MDIQTLLAVLLGGVLVNNYAFERFLGITPLLGCASNGKKAAILGAGVTLVMVLTAAVLWPIQSFILNPLSLNYLQTFLLPLIVLAVSYLAELISKLLLKKSLGIYFPILALNSAVLGLAASMSGNYLESIFAALGAGLGFLLGLTLMNGLQAKLNSSAVPKAFQGLPVQLLAGCILSMALLAFK